MMQRPKYTRSLISRDGKNNRKNSLMSSQNDDKFYSKSKQNHFAYSQSGFYSRQGSNSSKKIIMPNYVNEIGPGEYNVPAFSATQNISSSQNRNAPCFTLGYKTKQPYFP